MIPRFNWESVKGWIAILTFALACVGAATGLYIRTDREVQARMTAEQTQYLIDQRVSGFIAEVLRRLERIERKQDQAAAVERSQNDPGGLRRK